MAVVLAFSGVARGQSGLTKTLREAEGGGHVNGYYNKTDSQYSNGGLQVQLTGLTADASHKVEFSKNGGSSWSAANKIYFDGAEVTNAIISTDPAENAVNFDIRHNQLTGVPYSMIDGETIQIRVINDVFATKDTFVCDVTGGGQNLIYDVTLPTISSVSSGTGDGTYGISANIDVTVTFSEPTTLSNGYLRVALNTGQNVDIAAGTYSNTASENYTVQEGDLVDDLNNTSVSITGISLADAAGNEVENYVPGSSLGATSNIKIDGVRPTITSVTSTTSNGTYGIGSNINITVTFSEATTVAGGDLRVTLDVGRNVDITGATYNTTASGTYTILEGDASDDLTTTGISITAGTIEDGAGNALEVFTPASNLGITSALVIDGVRPTITSVNSSSASTTYGIGDNISIMLYFSEDVTLASGNLIVEVETGAVDRQAIITPFAGASPGIGTYTVQTGDVSDLLNENSVSLSGGTLQDAAGNDLTVFTVPPAENLNDNKDIVIDGIRPTISSVTSLSGNDNYMIGNDILIQVTFDEDVTLAGGNLLVTLETGTTDRQVTISSVISSSTATGTYTVQDGDENTDLTANVVSLSAGTLEDAGGNNITDFTIPPGQNIADLKAIVVDGVRPTIDYITSTTVDATYNIGDPVNIRLFFTEAVTTSGGGSIVVTLETGDTDRQVIISGVVSSLSADGSYTVQDGDESTDLNVNTVAMSAGSLVDDFGNAVTDFSIPGGSNLADAKALVIDGIRPTVTNVSAATPNGAYKAGDDINITVEFSEPVDVVGSPTLNLNVGGGYTISGPTGTGLDTLFFTYTVPLTHNSSDLDYVNTSALLVGTSIRDAAGNDATLILYAPGTGVPGAGSLGANKAIIIDTKAPTVLNVNSLKTDGYYKAGVTIPIAVVLSEAVTVGGTPQLTLDVGGGYAVDYANRISGDTLFFDYTVQAGHNSSDLAYTSTGALGFSGTIQDAAGNAATLTLAIPGDAKSLSDNKALVIDTTVPTVSSVSSTAADGYYVETDLIPISVAFTETVYVAVATPTLTLETGATDAVMGYVNGSDGDKELLFNYTVGLGHQSGNLDYTDTTALELNLATIRDAAGNDAVPTLPALGASGSLGFSRNRNIDAIIPTVTAVTSTIADGAYKAEVVIPIAVVFSENVGVLGTPTLTLDVGGGYDVDYANRISGDTLFFDYTVLPGHNKTDLGYVSTTALKLNGGSIQDVATNPADTTLPTPTDPASLSSSKNLDVDTTPPVFSSVAPATSSYRNSTAVSYTLSEELTSGTITWTRSSGATDVDHIQALTGTELAAGAHTDITLTNDPVLVSGAVYSVTFAGQDAAGNAAASVVSSGVTYDTQPPDIAGATVSDGLTTDIDYTNSSTSLSATYTGFSDPVAGVASYEYSIGTTAGGTQVLDWTGNGSDTSFTASGLNLSHNTRYFVNVRATDGAGNVSSAASSDGITVDTQAPTSTVEVTGQQFKAFWVADSSMNGTASDDLSGSDSVRITLQRASDGFYWDGAVWQAESSDLKVAVNPQGAWYYPMVTSELNDGVSYTLTSRAEDVAGNVQNIPATGSFTFVENSVPVVSTPLLDPTMNEDEKGSLLFQRLEDYFYDPDPGDTLSFSALILDTGLETISFTKVGNATKALADPDTNFYGQVKVKITATDTTGASISDTTLVTVLPTYDAPHLSIVTPASFVEDESLTVALSFLEGFVDDVYDQLETLVWSFAGDSLTVIPNTGATEFTVTNSQPDWNGSDTLQVMIVDDRFSRDTTTWAITVTPFNDPPSTVALAAPPDSALIAAPAYSPVISFSWSLASDVDSDSIAYIVTFSGSGYDSTITLGDTSVVVDLGTMGFPFSTPLTWHVSTTDLEKTTPAAGSRAFTVEPPDLTITMTTMRDTLRRNQTDTLTTVLGNANLSPLVWNVVSQPAWIAPITETPPILYDSTLMLSLVLSTASLRTGVYADTVVLASNDPTDDTTLVDVYLLVIGIPEITVHVVQNSVLTEHIQIFVIDTLGMADSISIVMDDSLRVSVTEIDTIDTFTYVGTHKLIGIGPHSLEVIGFSEWGNTTPLTYSPAMALAKQGHPWVAASVDQRFKTSGFPGSVSADRYLLVVDSTLMGLSAVRGGVYRLGDGQFSFNQPVRVSMRPGMNKIGREEAQAIYILRSNGRWEELPSVDEGELVTTWANGTGTFRLGRRTIIVPQTTSLHQNYPNPFNPSTRIVFDLGFQEGPLQHARVVIYNLLGQEVLTIYDGEATAGRYEIIWQGVDARGITVASGIYFVHLTTDSGQQMTRKMLLVR